MLGFYKKLKAGTKQEKYDVYKIKYNLAAICYEDAMKHPDVGNVSLYNALAHLAQVPELEISMTLYDHLQFNMHAELDTAAAEYVKLQIDHLNHIIYNL